ncbi:hypothetical protein ACMFMG_003792 [Clarireedia jacksonii]
MFKLTWPQREELATHHDVKDWGVYTTAKIGFLRTRDIQSKSIFRRHYRFPSDYNELAERRLWMSKLDDLIRKVNGHGRFIIEIEEEPNFNFYLILLLFAILFSVLAGVVYGLLRKNISEAMTLSSFIVAVAAMILAFLAVGEHFGLQKLDSEIAFDYNSESGDFDLANGIKMGMLDANDAAALAKSRRRSESRYRDDEINSK